MNRREKSDSYLAFEAGNASRTLGVRLLVDQAMKIMEAIPAESEDFEDGARARLRALEEIEDTVKSWKSEFAE